MGAIASAQSGEISSTPATLSSASVDVQAMKVSIRTMAARDRATWADLRAALWPDDSAEAHAQQIDVILRTDDAHSDAWGFIAELSDGSVAGYAEIAIRGYANGCDSQPVPFLEGIWVKPSLRRRGIGASLIAHIEGFVSARGFAEIGSDALIDNHDSHAAHHGWGFAETERVVYFRKRLSVQATPTTTCFPRD
jgi:aminoglycoside 6'-N-acetyltransferase I